MPTESFFTQSSLAYIASAGAGKDGKSYSIKPTDGTGDFTFSRGSNLAATRVGADGLIEKGRENLLDYSNGFFLWWSKSATTITDGQSGYDGSNDASLLGKTAAAGAVTRSISASGVQTFSVYAKKGSLNGMAIQVIGGSNPSAVFDLENGVLGILAGGAIKSAIQTIGNGWYRCSLVFNQSISSVRIYPTLANGDTSGTSGNIFIQDAQVEVGLVSTEYIESGATTGTAGILEDTPRFDYSNGASCPSLLLEPSRTNAFAHSEYFGSWNLSGGTLTANSTTSPEGLKNAYLYTEDTSTNYHRFAITASATNSNKVFTVYAKLANGAVNKFLTLDNGPTAWFDLENGTIGSTQGSVVISMEFVGNGWYRCIYHNPASSNGGLFIGIAPSNNGLGNHTGSGQPAFYAFGAQCEDNVVYPTSYIPTYGTSVTRAADVCGDAGDANTFNSTEGVLYAEIAALADDGTNRYISINDGNPTNLVSIAFFNNSDIRARIVIGGTTTYLSSGVITQTETLKIALKYKLNDYALWVNGVEVDSNISLGVFAPNTLTRVDFGRYIINDFYGKTKQVLTFNTALSDADLTALTTI